MIQERRIAANIINSTTEAQSSQRTNDMGFGEQNPNPTIQDREEAENARLQMGGRKGSQAGARRFLRIRLNTTTA
jgi:hypothetical protein